jgi:uncharacterized protein YdbL (DUF1318 family)
MKESKMKNKIFMTTLMLLIIGLLFSGSFASSESLKARMKTRLPIILELKAKGVVGENVNGYLQFVGEIKENEDVVEAENNDRRKVYTAIAQQQGTTAELVGKRRALRIAKKAKVGEWLQDQSGKWYQKK